MLLIRIFSFFRDDADFEDICIVERLFSSSLVAIVSLKSPRTLTVCHFRKGTEICNYSYSNTILAVKLNRAVSYSNLKKFFFSNTKFEPWSCNESIAIVNLGVLMGFVIAIFMGRNCKPLLDKQLLTLLVSSSVRYSYLFTFNHLILALCNI